MRGKRSKADQVMGGISQQGKILADISYTTNINTPETKSNPLDVMKKAIVGGLIGIILRSGFKEIKPSQYDENLQEVILPLANLTANKINITSADSSRVSALEIKVDPPTDKTIVVFQGQRGNFQDAEQLRRIAVIAKRTGCNVVAFNYRAVPHSQTDLRNDALAVTDYVFSTQRNGNKILDPKDVTFYGDSLGGAVAAITADKIIDDNQNVNLFLVRAPKSLAAAARFMITESQTINKLKKLFSGESVSKVFLSNDADLNAEQAIQHIGTKSNITIVTVQGDEIVPKTADLQNSLSEEQLENKSGDTQQLTIICETDDPTYAHHAPLDQLTVITDTENTKTVLDMLNESANRNPTPQAYIDTDKDTDSSLTE